MTKRFEFSMKRWFLSLYLFHLRKQIEVTFKLIDSTNKPKPEI